MHHGPSLANYQIEINFSASHLAQDGSTPNIKLAAKNEANKAKSETKKMTKTIKTYKKMLKKKKKAKKVSRKY